jgi:Arc/MetJ family transcription regulator
MMPSMCKYAAAIHIQDITMRTNIEIDDKIVAELMALTGARTKRQVVDEALRAQLDWTKAATGILSLQGKVEWEGDLDALRRDR